MSVPKDLLQHLVARMEDVYYGRLSIDGQAICAFLSDEVNNFYWWSNDFWFIQRTADQLSDLRKKAFRTWEFYSGNESYPVPDPARMRGYDAARQRYCKEYYYWDGPYGILRYCLLGHIIRCFKKELAKL